MKISRRVLLEAAKRAGLSRACVDVFVAVQRYELMPDGARPTLSTLARDASIAVRTVSACVAKLEAVGWLEVTRKHRQPSRYVSRSSLIVDHDQTARKKIIPSEISSSLSYREEISEGESLSPIGGRERFTHASGTRASARREKHCRLETASVAEGAHAAAADAAAAPRRGGTDALAESAVSGQATSAEDAEADAHFDAIMAALRKPKSPPAPGPTGAEPDSGRKDAPRIDGLGFG